MAKPKKEKPKQPKNLLFIEEYLGNGLNATKAYKTIYHSKSDQTAAVLGSKLLRNVKVRKRIEERIDEILKDKAQLTLKTIEELKRIAFADITEFLEYDNDQVTFRPSRDVDTRPVESVEIIRMKTQSIGEGEERQDVYTEKMKLKLHDKKSALDSLCRYLSLYKNIEIDAEINLITVKAPEPEGDENE